VSTFKGSRRTGASPSRPLNRLACNLSVRNLLDTEYTDFLWTYKAFAPNPGRDVRIVASLAF